MINNELFQVPLEFLDREIDYSIINPIISEYLRGKGIILFKHLKGDIKGLLKGVPKLGEKKKEQFILMEM